MKAGTLIGSVFKNADSDQVEWLDWQLQFIRATTENFDHVMFLNCEDCGPFEGKTKIIGTGDGTIQTSQQHRMA